MFLVGCVYFFAVVGMLTAQVQQTTMTPPLTRDDNNVISKRRYACEASAFSAWNLHDYKIRPQPRRLKIKYAGG